MNKKSSLIIIIGVIICGAAILIFSFVNGMKPDSAEEEKIKELARPYVNKIFDAPIEIYDTLYDNMGNFNFEYAAKAKHTGDQTEFLVYMNPNTEKLENDYVAQKFENKLESEIHAFLERKFIDLEDVWVFYDADIDSKFNIDINHTGSYKDYSAQPHIWIHLNGNQDSKDEQILNETLKYLKNKVGLIHGSVTISTKDNEELRKEF